MEAGVEIVASWQLPPDPLCYSNCSLMAEGLAGELIFWQAVPCAWGNKQPTPGDYKSETCPTSDLAPS